jgi:hypothetical protein
MADFVVPGWVVTFMPLLVLAITWLCRRVPELARYGPRNLGAAVSLVIAAIAVAADPPAVAGADLMEYIASAIAAALYWWKAAQVVYDVFTGQLATPERHAELSR